MEAEVYRNRHLGETAQMSLTKTGISSLSILGLAIVRTLPINKDVGVGSWLGDFTVDSV